MAGVREWLTELEGMPGTASLLLDNARSALSARDRGRYLGTVDGITTLYGQAVSLRDQILARQPPQTTVNAAKGAADKVGRAKDQILGLDRKDPAKGGTPSKGGAASDPLPTPAPEGALGSAVGRGAVIFGGLLAAVGAGALAWQRWGRR